MNYSITTKTEIQLIEGVSCYEENGVAYIRLEDAARGLGFTQEKNGVEYVKWERVEEYIRSFANSPLVGKDLNTSPKTYFTAFA